MGAAFLNFGLQQRMLSVTLGAVMVASSSKGPVEKLYSNSIIRFMRDWSLLDGLTLNFRLIVIIPNEACTGAELRWP